MADDTVEQARHNLRAFIREHETWLNALPIQHAGSPRLWTNMEHLVDDLIAAVRAEQNAPPTTITFPPEVDAKMRETDDAVHRAHGPVSERFMRHHYGASGHKPR